MASRRSITEIAFFDAILLFTSSFLSLASRFFSFSMSLTLISLLSVTVNAFGFSWLVLEAMEEEEGEGSLSLGLGPGMGMGCDSAGTAFEVGPRLNDGGNGWVGLENEAMDFSVCGAVRF